MVARRAHNPKVVG
ncbi:hypothetical protein D023_4080, partial [Vibrio parahaemolyticus 3256]